MAQPLLRFALGFVVSLLLTIACNPKEGTMVKKDQTGNAYVPGTYAHRKPVKEDLVGNYVKAWEKRSLARKKEEGASIQSPELPPCVAISRRIGVGALEIADMVASRLEYGVADRELIEQIASNANISQGAAAYFDERFPGYINRTFKFLFGEKAFTDNDYSRHLFQTVLAVATLSSTVFVGRGTHLILPRDRVLAVRCICSRGYRVERIAAIMDISKDEAQKQLVDIDKEQAAFFRKVFGRKSAQPDEFDMVVNLDHFNDPSDVAEIVALAFHRKFGA